MPKKRPVSQRISEAQQKLERLKDEQRMEALREKMRDRRLPRRRGR